jgi:hypothetical protein
MRWFGWFRRASAPENARAREWRRVWAEAVETPDRSRAEDLRGRLQQLAADEADADALDMEREMLEGLDALVELNTTVSAQGPPTISTGHRAVGADACHLSAPASLPDDPAQPSGTLLVTSTRLIFVGGAKSVTIPWHGVSECVRHDRDLLIARADRQDVQRLRCNAFADALCATFLVRHLASRRRRV